MIDAMKELLVLGAGGFIGRRFIEMFADKYDIIPIVSDADGTNPDLSNYDELLPIVEICRSYARLFNVIGPFQNENFFIPTLIRRVLKFKNNEIAEVPLKTLNAMREFIYIDDVCSAIDVLIEKGESGGIYNVCSGEGASIEKVIEIIKKLLNTPELPVNTADDHVRGEIWLLIYPARGCW
jgi:nucleoside-diphosphate-sugar epimerase